MSTSLNIDQTFEPLPGEEEQQTPKLVIFLDPEKALNSAAISVGRAEENDLELRHVFISKLHIVFEPGNPNWSLRDCLTRNGTNVNGNRAPSSAPSKVIRLVQRAAAYGYVGVNPTWRDERGI